MDLSTVETIVLDEFALRKGHRYAMVIVEPTRKRVLWVGRGREREDIRLKVLRLGAGDRSSDRAGKEPARRAFVHEIALGGT